MQYICLSVLTGKETDAIDQLNKKINELYKNQENKYHFLKDITLVHTYQEVDKTITGKIRKKIKATMNYIYVGFSKWNDELYHLVTNTPFVIKIVNSWRQIKDHIFTTQEEVDWNLSCLDKDVLVKTVTPIVEEAEQSKITTVENVFEELLHKTINLVKDVKDKLSFKTNKFLTVLGQQTVNKGRTLYSLFTRKRYIKRLLQYYLKLKNEWSNDLPQYHYIQRIYSLIKRLD
ncbi:hypothetical protein ABHN05_13285 [Brevibacillus laterosporus]|uniref:hypothetical protein n=1 Tax=Brevibacillus laterosporus TaxID=1465 RepID=UPI001127FA55|nr:hypothetical protein [Brevibacillus laterosporus]MBG9790954.1 hypothetical protein [Brevibacillus laterosporus]MBG9804923.1 hypothetical protein [Brevibacillus laterosporus]MED1790983.1 hypothetical protein [Brevibacillus laterosporus]MED4762066.1 hypothetical protein [Brevibacillus laterosporus]TPH09928.1 hypothetical protein EGH09_21465 [Brevibacillus laterosporus]